MATAKTIQKQKELLLEKLRTYPIVSMACKKADIGRATFYRWCQEDEAFRVSVDNAKIDGIESVNDLSEAQLIELVRSRNYSAIQLWLRYNHSRFMSEEKKDMLRRIEKKVEFNERQKELLKEALAHFK